MASRRWASAYQQALLYLLVSAPAAMGLPCLVLLLIGLVRNEPQLLVVSLLLAILLGSMSAWVSLSACVRGRHLLVGRSLAARRAGGRAVPLGLRLAWEGEREGRAYDAHAWSMHTLAVGVACASRARGRLLSRAAGDPQVDRLPPALRRALWAAAHSLGEQLPDAEVELRLRPGAVQVYLTSCDPLRAWSRLGALIDVLSRLAQVVEELAPASDVGCPAGLSRAGPPHPEGRAAARRALMRMDLVRLLLVWSLVWAFGPLLLVVLGFGLAPLLIILGPELLADHYRAVRRRWADPGSWRAPHAPAVEVPCMGPGDGRGASDADRASQQAGGPSGSGWLAPSALGLDGRAELHSTIERVGARDEGSSHGP